MALLLWRISRSESLARLAGFCARERKECVLFFRLMHILFSVMRHKCCNVAKSVRILFLLTFWINKSKLPAIYAAEKSTALNVTWLVATTHGYGLNFTSFFVCVCVGYWTTSREKIGKGTKLIAYLLLNKFFPLLSSSTNFSQLATCYVPPFFSQVIKAAGNDNCMFHTLRASKKELKIIGCELWANKINLNAISRHSQSIDFNQIVDDWKKKLKLKGIPTFGHSFN